jgi:hypothetical protein
LICANCGSEQVATFCAQCGQNDRDYQRGLPPLLWDLVRETFEVDSRLLRTLKLLLFKPGELSLEFSRNRRASYVSPFRLYLFINLLFFLLVAFSTDIETSYQNVVVTDAELTSDSTADVNLLFQIVDEDRRAKLDAILDRPDPSIGKKLLLSVAEDFVTESAIAEQVAAGHTPQLDPFARYMFGKLIDAIDDPREVVRGLVDNLPLLLFVMLPIYAAVLSLFYLKRRRYYIENLVFATHLHSFAFVIYALMLILPDKTWLDMLLMATMAVYHFTALKRYFDESIRRTCVKYMAQVIVYFLLLLPPASGLIAVFTLATV